MAVAVLTALLAIFLIIKWDWLMRNVHRNEKVFLEANIF